MTRRQQEPPQPAPQSTPVTVPADPTQLAARILAHLKGEDRFILGVTGPPGTGKSTVVAAIAQALQPHRVVVVPMDGFHLANAVIRGTPLEHRKGAIDTFDAAGYVHLMQRLHRRNEEIVYAPSYVRDVEEPIAAAIAVPREVQIVITEGNYLLAPTAQWPAARAVIDQVWYLDTPDLLRLHRLTSRHVSFGKTEPEAAAWVQSSDEVNARMIAQTRDRADLIIQQD
ncbi:MAG: nucleoside/nucleotide kinase family protein [Nakamurella sp.]